MASGSQTAAKFAELKKDVVEILSSCEGHRLDLSRFKEEYKNRFRKSFDKRYKVFKTGWTMKNLMAKLDDVIYLEESEHHKSAVLMKLKEPDSARHDLRNHLTSPDKLEATCSVGFQQVKLDSPAESPLSQATGKESKPAASANMSHSSNDPSNISGRKFLKAQRRLEKKSTESKEKYHESTGENVAASISPPAVFLGASHLGLPLSPPPVSRLHVETSGILRNKLDIENIVCVLYM